MEFKVGDRVRIRPNTTQRDYDESGPGWNDYMPATIGKIGTVIYIYIYSEATIIRVEFETHEFSGDKFDSWNYEIKDVQHINEARLEKLNGI